MKRFFLFFLIIFCFFWLLFLTYGKRSEICKSYDAPYWKDKLEKSQWKLPLSNRTLGDNGYYLAVGYDLANGADPSLVNAETPPLGKYLIGLTTRFTGYPAIYGILTTLFLFLSTYGCMLVLSKSHFLSLAAGTLIITDPLTVSQYGSTMLDTLQTSLLICAFLLFTKGFERPACISHKLLIFFSGIFLGLFGATKFPPLLFVTLLSWSIPIVWKKQFTTLFFLFLGTCFGYLIPYIQYFFIHQSFLDFLKFQKWIIAFYAIGKTIPNYGSAIFTLFTNTYQNIFTRAFEHASEWSISWPITAILAIYFLIQSVKKKNDRQNIFISLAFLLSSFLIFFSIIPFWTRYLLVMLPFFYIAALLFLSKKIPQYSIYCIMVLIFFNSIASILVIAPNPRNAFKETQYEWEHNYFQDIYEHIPEKEKTIPRAVFHTKALQFLTNAQIEHTTITPILPQFSLFKNSYEIPITLTYTTRYIGTFTTTTTLLMEKEHGTWVFHFPWNNIFPGLTDDSSIETTIDFGKRGSIYKKDRTLLASDIPSILISVTPAKIKHEEEEAMLWEIEALFGKDVFPKVNIHNRYTENYDPNTPIAIGIPNRPLSQEELSSLQKYSGITITPALGRSTNLLYKDITGLVRNSSFEERDTRIYNTSSYEGITGFELTYNKTLKGKNGGTIFLYHDNEKHIIYETKKENGYDVTINNF